MHEHHGRARPWSKLKPSAMRKSTALAVFPACTFACERKVGWSGEPRGMIRAGGEVENSKPPEGPVARKAIVEEARRRNEAAMATGQIRLPSKELERYRTLPVRRRARRLARRALELKHGREKDKT